MNSMPIDLATVDWLYVVVLALFVFLATLIANVLCVRPPLHRARVLSAVLFAAAFVFWTYYPHHLPLPTALAPQKAAVTARARAGRSGRAGQAAQSGHRHHAAEAPATPPQRQQRRRPHRRRARLASKRLIDVLSRFARVKTVRESGGVA